MGRPAQPSLATRAGHRNDLAPSQRPHRPPSGALAASTSTRTAFAAPHLVRALGEEGLNPVTTSTFLKVAAAAGRVPSRSRPVPGGRFLRQFRIEIVEFAGPMWLRGFEEDTASPGQHRPARTGPRLKVAWRETLGLLTAAALLAGCAGVVGVAVRGPGARGDARNAVTALDHLSIVRTRPRVGGYDRNCARGRACSFGPAWTDATSAAGGHNGCDTRNDVLRAQLRNVVFKQGSRGCVVLAGTLSDPYTGHRIQFRKADAGAVQIDHVYPLARAWDMGASTWTPARRADYANDESLVLIAVDGPANQAKGDSGPAEWMPSNRAFACAYDTRYVQIAAKYQLPVTAAEKSAISRVLRDCRPHKNTKGE